MFLLMLHDGILIFIFVVWFSFLWSVVHAVWGTTSFVDFSRIIAFLLLFFLFLSNGLLQDICYWKGNAIWVVQSIQITSVVTVSCCFYHFCFFGYWIITIPLNIPLHIIPSWHFSYKQTIPFKWFNKLSCLK